jgi:hypothetical protein
VATHVLVTSKRSDYSLQSFRIDMSFLGIRQLTASCSRSALRSSVHSTPRTPFQVKRFSSTEPPPARHPIGRIIPKRIAVRVPRQQASDVPEPTIWQPIVVSGSLVFIATT